MPSRLKGESTASFLARMKKYYSSRREISKYYTLIEKMDKYEKLTVGRRSPEPEALSKWTVPTRFLSDL